MEYRSQLPCNQYIHSRHSFFYSYLYINKLVRMCCLVKLLAFMEMYIYSTYIHTCMLSYIHTYIRPYVVKESYLRNTCTYIHSTYSTYNLLHIIPQLQQQFISGG